MVSEVKGNKFHTDEKIDRLTNSSLKKKSENEQNIAWAIIQAAIETTKAVIMFVREADNSVNSARLIHKICLDAVLTTDVLNTIHSST